jgi:hypothetical protein
MQLDVTEIDMEFAGGVEGGGGVGGGGGGGGGGDGEERAKAARME